MLAVRVVADEVLAEALSGRVDNKAALAENMSDIECFLACFFTFRSVFGRLLRFDGNGDCLTRF